MEESREIILNDPISDHNKSFDTLYGKTIQFKLARATQARLYDLFISNNLKERKETFENDNKRSVQEYS